MTYIKYNNKKVYYKIKGNGEPLLLLHGNTVSSKLFSGVTKKYSKYFKVILIDFPGHGKSDRLEKFETDFWFFNSEVCFQLIKKLKLEKASVVGTSGGALVALNLAMEHPECIKSVIADSFEGEYPLESYINSIESDRDRDKKKLLAKLYWRFCHGSDWKTIVDKDTKANIEFAKTGKSFFQKSISELCVPTLLTGSIEDEYCDHLDRIYDNMKQKNKSLKIHLFDKGKHPAMLSNKKDFFDLLIKWHSS